MNRRDDSAKVFTMKTNKGAHLVHAKSHRDIVPPASLPDEWTEQRGSRHDKVRELIMRRLLDYQYAYPAKGTSSPTPRRNTVSPF
jgi:hypothetical protein